MIIFFRKNERHCFTLGVVKNYFAHLSILKRYFSLLLKSEDIIFVILQATSV